VSEALTQDVNEPVVLTEDVSLSRSKTDSRIIVGMSAGA
jgi:hypothetical protein